MKTSAILTPASPTLNSMPKAAPQGASEGNLPFKQVLSREVSERRDSAQENRNDTSKPGAPKGTTASADTAKAPNEPTSEKADKAENVPVTDETAASQLLALAAQLAQFTAIAPQASADGHLPAASARLGAVPGTAAAKDPAAKDALAGLTLLADDGAALDADFEYQLGAAAGKNQESRPGVSAAALVSAQQFAADRTQEIQSGISTPEVVPTQQSASGQMQAAAGPLADKIAPQVGSKGWDQAFAQKVVWMVAGAQQSASLTLNPPDLGPLQVVLNVSNAQATANFIAAQPEVRQALEAAMPRLREMLEDAGIQLGQANVSAGNPQQQGTFDQRPQGSASSGHAEVAGDVSIHAKPGNAQVTRQGLVDTFA